MENTMKMYVTADEAAQILGVSRGYAYKIIRGLNNDYKWANLKFYQSCLKLHKNKDITPF